LREGINPADDKISDRFFNDAFSKGQAKNIKISKDEFQKSLLEYYSIREWTDKGIPTEEKLKKLGLEKYG
jgi:aldehyde:ferredoxin oxidoreductase